MSTSTPATRAWQAEQGRLLGIAYRMLGDFGHAEDVVSEVALEALQAERMPHTTVASWPAWLTTVCVRRSIDRVRREAAIREEYPGPWLPEPVATELLPEEAVTNGELLSLALLHLAEQLDPEPRAALILHRAFAMTAPEIGSVLGKSPAAIRQMISRAERRLQIDEDSGAPTTVNTAAINGLIAAIHNGDVNAVLQALEPEAVLWSDGGGKVSSARRPVMGADNIVRFLLGILGKAAEVSPDQPPILEFIEVNGEPAIDFLQPGLGRRDVVTLQLSADGRVRGIRQVSNPDKLTRARV